MMFWLAGIEMEEQMEEEIDGALSLLVYGGLFGKKGIQDALKMQVVKYRKSR